MPIVVSGKYHSNSKLAYYTLWKVLFYLSMMRRSVCDIGHVFDAFAWHQSRPRQDSCSPKLFSHCMTRRPNSAGVMGTDEPAFGLGSLTHISMGRTWVNPSVPYSASRMPWKWGLRDAMPNNSGIIHVGMRVNSANCLLGHCYDNRGQHTRCQRMHQRSAEGAGTDSETQWH